MITPKPNTHRLSHSAMLSLCCDFAMAVLKRHLTWEEWNDVNRDVTRYRQQRRVEKPDKWSRG